MVLLDLLADLIRGQLVAPIRIEPRDEQLKEHRRDIGMCEQHPHHVRGGERDPRLTQVFAYGADHRDLTAGEPSREDEAIQSVVLELSAPDAEERIMEVVAYPFGVGHRNLHTEVVDPRGRPIAGRDLIGPLVDDVGAHVLECRQHVRQRYAARAEQLAAHQPRRRLQRPIEVENRLVP